MQAAQRRLLDAARKAEDEALNEARTAVLKRYRSISLKQAEKALTAALSLPRAKRPAAIRGVLQLVAEASKATGTPPPELLPIFRRAVRDRVVNAGDLAELTGGVRLMDDTRELEAHAVSKARRDMNTYWARLPKAFRDDTAKVVRQAIRQNLDPEKAADLLQARLNVSRSRAVLIAQDQILTAGATSERNLLKAAGVKEFMYWTLKDGRVRPAHAALHGKVYTWRGAPILPGVEVRCRCRALVPTE